MSAPEDKLHGYDPVVAAAMIGPQPDLDNILKTAQQLAAPPEYLFDYIAVSRDPAAVTFAAGVAPDKVRYISQFLRWKLPQGIDLLKKAPEAKWDVLAKMIAHAHTEILQHIPHIEFKDGEFCGEIPTRYLALLNDKTKDLAALFANKPTIEPLHDPAIMAISESLPTFLSSQDRVQLAVATTFFPKGMALARAQGIAIKDLAQAASSFELHAANASKYAGYFPSENLRWAVNYASDEYRRVELQENAFARPLTVEAAILIESQKVQIRGHIHDISKFPYWVQEQFIQANRADLLPFALTNGLIGYRLDLPVVQVGDQNKIRERSAKAIAVVADVADTVRAQDIAQEYLPIVQAHLGRKKSYSWHELQNTRAVDLERCVLSQVAKHARGLSRSNLQYIAQVAGIPPFDLEKIAALSASKDLNAKELEASIAQFLEMSKRPALPLESLVEGYITATAVQKSIGGLLSEQSNEKGILFALHANDAVIKKLSREGHAVETHYPGVVAYARCYRHENVLRIEEFQSDIFEEEVPSSLKKKYEHWPGILLLAIEHFAIERGISTIQANPPYIQLEKWANHFGLCSKTAYQSYVRYQQQHGFNLKEGKLQQAEYVGEGIDFSQGDRLPNWQRKFGRMFDLVWEKQVDPKRRSELESYFFITPQSRAAQQHIADLARIFVAPVSEHEEL